MAALTAPEHLERERHARAPLVGPHRDDLLFLCLGRPAALSLSRGQKRRVVAAAILAWRSEHGRFTRVEELQEIEGIGVKTLQKLAPLVRV